LFSEEAILRPCRVDIGLNANAKSNHIKKHQRVQSFCRQDISTDQQDDKDNPEISKLQHRCMLCKSVSSCHYNLVKHMRKNHSGLFILCKHNGVCTRIFLTEAEKSEHNILELANKNAKLMKCDFCCIMYFKKDKANHFDKHHKNLIRCSYINCSIFFFSEAEKRNHESHVHARTEKSKRIFCNLFFHAHTMLVHFRSMHKSLIPSAFKCKLNCRRYFRTEAELSCKIMFIMNQPGLFSPIAIHIHIQ
jgi:hypothetical protein